MEYLNVQVQLQNGHIKHVFLNRPGSVEVKQNDDGLIQFVGSFENRSVAFAIYDYSLQTTGHAGEFARQPKEEEKQLTAEVTA